MTFGCWPKDYCFRKVGTFLDPAKPDHPQQELANFSMTFMGHLQLSHRLR